jgi:hypothetical protein
MLKHPHSTHQPTTLFSPHNHCSKPETCSGKTPHDWFSQQRNLSQALPESILLPSNIILLTAQNLHTAISISVKYLNKQNEGRHFEQQDEIKAQVHHWVQMCPLVCKLRGEIKKNLCIVSTISYSTHVWQSKRWVPCHSDDIYDIEHTYLKQIMMSL